jgi:hypothetical protein
MKTFHLGGTTDKNYKNSEKDRCHGETQKCSACTKYKVMRLLVTTLVACITTGTCSIIHRPKPVTHEEEPIL